MAREEYEVLQRYLESADSGAPTDRLAAVEAWHLVALAAVERDAGGFDFPLSELEVDESTLALEQSPSPLVDLIGLRQSGMYQDNPAFRGSFRKAYASRDRRRVVVSSSDVRRPLWILAGDMAFPADHCGRRGPDLFNDGSFLFFETPPLRWSFGDRSRVLPGVAWRCVRERKPSWFPTVRRVYEALRAALAERADDTTAASSPPSDSPSSPAPAASRNGFFGLESVLLSPSQAESVNEGLDIVLRVIRALNDLGRRLTAEGRDDVCAAIDAQLEALSAELDQLVAGRELDVVRVEDAFRGDAAFFAGSEELLRSLDVQVAARPAPGTRRNFLSPGSFSDPLVVDRASKAPWRGHFSVEGSWYLDWLIPADPEAISTEFLELGCGLLEQRCRVGSCDSDDLVRFARMLHASWPDLVSDKEDERATVEHFRRLFGLACRSPEAGLVWSGFDHASHFDVTYERMFDFDADPGTVAVVERPLIQAVESGEELARGRVRLAAGARPDFAKAPFLSPEPDAASLTVDRLADAISEQRGGLCGLAAELFTARFALEPELVRRVDPRVEGTDRPLSEKLLEAISITGDLSSERLASSAVEALHPVFLDWARQAPDDDIRSIPAALARASRDVELTPVSELAEAQGRFVWRAWINELNSGLEAAAIGQGRPNSEDLVELWSRGRLVTSSGDVRPGSPGQTELRLESVDPLSGVFNTHSAEPSASFPLHAAITMPDHPAARAFPGFEDHVLGLLSQDVDRLQRSVDKAEALREFAGFMGSGTRAWLLAQLESVFTERRSTVGDGLQVKPTPPALVDLIGLCGLKTVLALDAQRLPHSDDASVECVAVWSGEQPAGEIVSVVDPVLYGEAPPAEARPVAVVSAGERPEALLELCQRIGIEVDEGEVRAAFVVDRAAREARFFDKILATLGANPVVLENDNMFADFAAYVAEAGLDDALFPPPRAFSRKGWSRPESGLERSRVCAVRRWSVRLDPALTAPRPEFDGALLRRVEVDGQGLPEHVTLRLPDSSWNRGLAKCLEGQVPDALRSHLGELLFPASSGEEREQEIKSLLTGPSAIRFLEPLLGELNLAVFPSAAVGEPLTRSDREVLGFLPFVTDSAKASPSDLFKAIDWSEAKALAVGKFARVRVGSRSSDASEEPTGRVSGLERPGVFRRKEFTGRRLSAEPETASPADFWVIEPKGLELTVSTGGLKFLNTLPGLPDPGVTERGREFFEEFKSWLKLQVFSHEFGLDEDALQNENAFAAPYSTACSSGTEGKKAAHFAQIILARIWSGYFEVADSDSGKALDSFETFFASRGRDSEAFLRVRVDWKLPDDDYAGLLLDFYNVTSGLREAFRTRGASGSLIPVDLRSDGKVRWLNDKNRPAVVHGVPDEALSQFVVVPLNGQNVSLHAMLKGRG